MLKEEIKHIDQSTKALRKFGLTVGIVLLAITAVLFFNNRSGYVYFGAVGIFLSLAGIIFPKVLKPFNKVWMSLALIIGWFTSRLILILLYYFVITPIGIIARIAGKDFISERWNKEQKSYWVKREIKSFSKEEFERQF
jgi:hypothetical protein